MNKKDPKNQKIQVFARCRPLNSIETKQCSPSVVEVVPEKKEIVLKVGNTTREFCFDKVFPPDTKQIAVYKAVVGPLIQEVLMGYNCTVFAYGQTGTGKTYTMEGERNNSKCSWEADPGAGIIPRSLHQLFEELNKEENVEFSVRVSFLELYNEELFDLLGSTELSAERTKLRLYEDTNRKGSVIIQGLEEILVNNKDEVYSILEKGTARRQTAATMLNATSSRSHTVFSVTVHIKENTVEGEELLKTGKLNLVDLAGSENVGRSGAINSRAREAGNINQSLLTLGRVITALIEKQPHVPYRESKLTRLLQDSLGGHTKTSIIATISPAQCNFDETISTLDYATKAKSITIKPEVNQKMTKRALIREYTEEIERLRKDLAALRSSQGFYIDADNYKSLTDKIEHLTSERTKVEEMFTTTKEELEKIQVQYTETEQKYSETKEALNYTQEVLSKTTLERDEKEYLINYQNTKEKQLLLQSKKLLNVAEQTRNDTNKLHAKIERKTGVEKTNEQLWKDFRMQSQKHTAHLEDKITDNAEEKNKFFQFLDELRVQVQSDLISHKQKTKRSLDALMEEQRSLLNDFSNQLNEKTTNEIRWSNGLSEDMNSKKDDFVAMYEKFLTQRLPSLLNQLNSQTADMEAWMLNTQNNLHEKVHQHVHNLEAQIVQDKRSISTLKSRFQSFLSQHDAEVLEYKRQIQSLSESKKDLDQLKTHLLSGLKICTALEEKTETAQLKINCSNFEKSTTELSAAKESVNVLETGIQAREDEVKKMTDIPGVIKLDEFNLIKDSNLQCHKSVSSEFGDLLKHSQKMQIDSYQEAKAALECHNTYIHESKQNNESTINTISTSLSNKIDEERICMEQNVQSLEIILNNSKDVSEVERKRSSEADSQLKKGILKYDLEIEKFYSEDLVKDIPTGTTPQRKSYDYPSKLVTSSPADRVLQRFHSQLAADTIAAINLPLDCSFNESEEKSSDGSAANSHEVSFTSEVYDSDGVESDSSAVSDISTDSKNKENYKKSKKASRLPKRTQKFKGFLKPAPISIKKPLLATNADANSRN